MKNVILGHFNVNLRLGLDPRLDVQSKKKLQNIQSNWKYVTNQLVQCSFFVGGGWRKGNEAEKYSTCRPCIYVRPDTTKNGRDVAFVTAHS